MVSYGRVELLSHELSLKYLKMKWNAYGKYINSAHLILYCLFLAFVTIFAASIVVHDNELVETMEEEMKFERQMRKLGRPINDTIIASRRTQNVRLN